MHICIYVCVCIFAPGLSLAATAAVVSSAGTCRHASFTCTIRTIKVLSIRVVRVIGYQRCHYQNYQSCQLPLYLHYQSYQYHDQYHVH